MRIHESVTEERVMEAVQADDNIGICIECGEEQGGCEPDAEQYKCEACEQYAVYGAEQLLFHIAS